ncbi:MAG: redoxin domain-containing protein [Candidatus Binataceae bacterium]
MPQISETILAPSLGDGEWLQGGPLSLDELRGKAVVLIDFWDYTCVNCLRTLSYVAEWHRRYHAHGLVVIGVHAPEFSFARERANVIAAIKNFSLEYPIVLDNGYAIWRAYSNRYWPAKYLADPQGRLRYYHFGEGLYHETESQIQKLLLEMNPSLVLPAPMEPVRDSDRPGALCYRVTPELYLGYARGQFGNPAGVMRDRVADYQDPGRHAEGAVYLSGRWTVDSERARAEEIGAALALRYTAMDVNLVLTPGPGGVARAEIVIDSNQRPGADVKIENGRAFVTIERPRMYNLVANESVLAGGLQFKALDPGLSGYAFTFISCVVS